eukprot:COSAG01_NODE_2578_length_7431_cov_6.566148_4_plen_61_part_00
MDAVLTTLVAKHGLGNAVNVLETGASAGGLAAYLHADHVCMNIYSCMHNSRIHDVYACSS